MKIGAALLGLLALASGLAGQAPAAVVTSLPNGTIVPMPDLNYFGGGPRVFGSNIEVTWSSTNANNGVTAPAVFGLGPGGTYWFGDNGYWDTALGNVAGLNDSTLVAGVTDIMTFAFSSPQSAVGGFLNYAPNSSHPTTVAVYDSAMNLIESTNLTFHTDGSLNSGQFIGFELATPIISYLVLTDNYIAITNLTVVPEPSGSALLGLAIATGLAHRSYGRIRRTAPKRR